MAKTYDFNTPIGQVRFYTGETDVEKTPFTDEEIQGLLDGNDQDVYMAASLLWNAKAAQLAGKARKYTRGQVSEDTVTTAEYALKMAKFYAEKAESEPYAEIAEIGGTDFQKREILIEDDY